MCCGSVSPGFDPMTDRLGFPVTAAMAVPMIRMTDLLEHFGLFPSLLFAAEGGAKSDYQGGKSERFFHELNGKKERLGGCFATGNGFEAGRSSY